jgi:hypothetical protein
METETLLRVVAVVIAAMILATNWDYSWIIPKLKSLFVFKKSEQIKKEVSFLEIMESWHILRNRCEQHGLKEAIEKIDEVFPLLNTED